MSLITTTTLFTVRNPFSSSIFPFNQGSGTKLSKPREILSIFFLTYLIFTIKLVKRFLEVKNADDKNVPERAVGNTQGDKGKTQWNNIYWRSGNHSAEKQIQNRGTI